MSKWAKTHLTSLIEGTTHLHPSSGVLVEATQVESLDGDASISVIRGRKRYIFDYNFKVKWEACVEVDGEEVEIQGSMFYPDFSSDQDDEVFERELKWENRSKAKSLEKALVKQLKEDFADEIQAKLEVFMKDFHARG